MNTTSSSPSNIPPSLHHPHHHFTIPTITSPSHHHFTIPTITSPSPPSLHHPHHLHHHFTITSPSPPLLHHHHHYFTITTITSPSPPSQANGILKVLYTHIHSVMHGYETVFHTTTCLFEGPLVHPQSWALCI